MSGARAFSTASLSRLQDRISGPDTLAVALRSPSAHLPPQPAGMRLVLPSTQGTWHGPLCTQPGNSHIPRAFFFFQHHTLYLSLSPAIQISIWPSSLILIVVNPNAECIIKNLIETNSSHISLPPKYSYQLDKRFGYITL